MDRVLFSYWPKVLRKSIAIGLLDKDKNLNIDWLNCAINFRNDIIHCLLSRKSDFEENQYSKKRNEVCCKNHKNINILQKIGESFKCLLASIKNIQAILNGIQEGIDLESDDILQICQQLFDQL